MKGYQISQYDLPIAIDGSLSVEADGSPKAVGVRRVHLEEDVAKLQHFPGDDGGYSLVDVNRSGVPLMEIVSEPDMRSAEEARSYLTTLHSLLQYLGVTTGNLQDGSFRCDANISIRPAGSEEFGNRTEIKNMNSFRSVYQALNFEAERQRRVLDGGGRVVPGNPWLGGGAGGNRFPAQQGGRPRLSLLPRAGPASPGHRPRMGRRNQGRVARACPPAVPALLREFALPEYDARLLTASKAVADYFETAVTLSAATGPARQGHAKQVSNWMLGDLASLLNQENRDISESPVFASASGRVNRAGGLGHNQRDHGQDGAGGGLLHWRRAGSIVEERGYTQISDTSAVEPAVIEALDANPRAVADYLSGKESAAKFLVGR